MLVIWDAMIPHVTSVEWCGIFLGEQVQIWRFLTLEFCPVFLKLPFCIIQNSAVEVKIKILTQWGQDEIAILQATF